MESNLITIAGRDYKLQSRETVEEARDRGLHAHADDMEAADRRAMICVTRVEGGKAAFGWEKTDGTFELSAKS